MLDADLVLKSVREEQEKRGGPFATKDEFDNFIFEKFGKSEEVYDLLCVIVKSASEYLMNVYDSLPEGIRKKLAECSIELDVGYIQEQVNIFGPDTTEQAIDAMERLAIRLLNKEWEKCGATR